MKNVVITTTYRCDCCCKECIPTKSIVLPFSYGRDTTNSMVINITGDIPYCTTEPDFCLECINKALSNYMSSKGL